MGGFNGRTSIIPGMHNGHIEYLLRWSEDTPGPWGGRRVRVKQSHWFADVDEAMAVRMGMRAGLSFEQALNELFSAVGLNT